MTEGMTGYAESATAGLNGGYGGKINPDYGRFDRKCWLEINSPKLFELMLKCKDVFLDFEECRYGGYDENAEQMAIAALKQILAEY